MAVELRIVIDVLRRVSPLPDDALLVGAWVPSLYASRDVFLSPPVATRDIDFALSTTPGNRKRHREWADSLPARLGPSRYELRYEGTSYEATPFTVLSPVDDVESLPEIEVIVELRGGGRREPQLRKWFPGEFVPQGDSWRHARRSRGRPSGRFPGPCPSERRSMSFVGS